MKKAKLKDKPQTNEEIRRRAVIEMAQQMRDNNPQWPWKQCMAEAKKAYTKEPHR